MVPFLLQWLVIRGFGLGAVTMPVIVVGYIGLDKQQIPHSSVLTRTAQQIGGSFGTAVLAVILEGAIAAHPATPTDAFHVAFWWAAGFSAIAVLLSLWLPAAQRAPEATRGSAPGQPTDPAGAQTPAGQATQFHIVKTAANALTRRDQDGRSQRPRLQLIRPF